MVLYALAIFLSAFLLFQVQPIIAKMVLPWFGGTSAVWTTCMLFFQLVLLAGYGYAHWLNSRRSRTVQAGLHTALLAASLAMLPIVPKASWKPDGHENPAWLLLGLLAATVGLPYFLLSTTSPLLQAWYARSRKGAMPYRLFALSNLASMLALLSYPPVVEPNLSTHWQAWLWSAAYCCFALLCAALAWSGGRWRLTPEMTVPEESSAIAPGWGLRVLWMGLAACASTLLLAVTNFLTQDIAAIPFLWIVPLSVYLLSFILCFESRRLYWRLVYLPLLPVALGVCTWFILDAGVSFEIKTAVVALTICLFVFCMVLHGELASLKPHPRYLTGFYLMVSAGGAFGGVFVGLVAPNFFNGYHEFPIGLGMCAVLAGVVLYRAQVLGRRAGCGKVVSDNLFSRPDSAGSQHLSGRKRSLTPFFRVLGKSLVASGLLGYLVFLGSVIRDSVRGYDLVVRNFYGRLAVYEDASDLDDSARHLMHGVIDHGIQALDPAYRRLPVSYFCASSGVGVAMRSLPEGLPHKVGVLGLGCGTLAAYMMPSDILRIYEINPLVVEIARSRFTYLKDTAAHTEIVMGDGRLSLEREPGQQFDLLVMDAFSGDSVPVHLLTREAFRTYFRHLKPDGILAVNITNRYLNLSAVVERAATDFGKVAMVFDDDPMDEYLCYSSSWALVMAPSVRAHMRDRFWGRVLTANSQYREWTDDFSNMQRILK